MKVVFGLITLSFTVGFVLFLCESTSFLYLKLKYPAAYEKHSSAFGFKFKAGRANYDKQRADYFMMHPVYGVKFKPKGKFYSLNPDDKGFPKYDKVNGLVTDKFGYVQTLPEQRSSGEEFIVVVSGGSTTAGVGATENGKTWPAVLQKKIQSFFKSSSIDKSVRVINSGVLGYAASQELQQYMTETQFHKPQLVISFNGINERWSYEGSPIEYSFSGHQNRIINLIQGKTDLNVVGFLPNTKLAIKILSRKKIQKYGYESLKNLSYQGKDIFLWKMNNFKSLVTGNGSAFLHVLQPLMGVCPEELSGLEKPFKNFFASDFYKKSWSDYIGGARQFYSQVRPLLSKKWQVDLTCMFEENDQLVYYDPRHYNDYGQSLVAESIFQELLKRNLLNPVK